jgi:hypothetical protein
LTIAGYLILFVALIGTFLDFVKSRHLFDYASFCVLAFCAFAREQELLRWVMGREDSALNLKFLTNVNNSIQIKILVILIFVALVLAFIHLARQYAIKIIKEFFRFGATAWSFATFVLFFLLGQSIDSVPSKLEKFVNIHLSNELQLKLEAVEECTEIFLPIVAAIIFVQFHYMLKNKEE